ncbi:MAG: hypothetical protein MK080_01770 [Opitutales bacterium]|nr:hypothetical protein [Opitutales bacterium]
MSSEFIESLVSCPKGKKQNVVSYFPLFGSNGDLANHYYRAKWYLPQTTGYIEEVQFFTDGKLKVGQRPECFGEAPSSNETHLKLVSEELTPQVLLSSRVILVWSKISQEYLDVFKKHGILVFNVDTHDANEVEYGNYCKVLWKVFSKVERDAEIEASRQRFDSFAERLRTNAYKNATVFGTGPSIEKAFDFNFEETLTVICNTAILDRELCDHLKPDVVCAGDVVSHFGVSAYAFEFREKLRNFLARTGAVFFTTAQFGYLFLAHNEDLRDQIIFADQKGDTPNYSLSDNFYLPCLDSTFNIHMMTMASNFHDEIFVLGCDGKNPDETKNEDFWAHSKRAQMHDLVDTGHQSHPVFDVHRKQSTWDRYKNSTQFTCALGEAFYGKVIRSLAPSYTPGLAERYLPKESTFKAMLKDSSNMCS